MGGLFTTEAWKYEKLIGLCHGDAFYADQLIGRERSLHRELTRKQAIEQVIHKLQDGSLSIGWL